MCEHVHASGLPEYTVGTFSWYAHPTTASTPALTRSGRLMGELFPSMGLLSLRNPHGAPPSTPHSSLTAEREAAPSVAAGGTGEQAAEWAVSLYRLPSQRLIYYWYLALFIGSICVAMGRPIAFAVFLPPPTHHTKKFDDMSYQPLATLGGPRVRLDIHLTSDEDEGPGGARNSALGRWMVFREECAVVLHAAYVVLVAGLGVYLAVIAFDVFLW